MIPSLEGRLSTISVCRMAGSHSNDWLYVIPLRTTLDNIVNEFMRMKNDVEEVHGDPTLPSIVIKDFKLRSALNLNGEGKTEIRYYVLMNVRITPCDHATVWYLNWAETSVHSINFAISQAGMQRAEQYYKALCDSELYMTCLQFKMSDTAIATFHKYANKQETPVVASKGSSSSSPITVPSISMSSTVAPTMEIPADVSESKNSERNADSPDIIEDFFGLQNVQASTGSISQSISRQANGTQYILRSPVECGTNVVKLEIYPFAKICGLDKKNWWKHTETKMLFLTTSSVDPLQMHVNKIQNMVLKEVSKIKGIQKETKEINYWNSFGGFQQRQ